MKTKILECILVAFFSGICTLSFSQKIPYEITLKGNIANIEETLPFITEKTFIQLVEYAQNFTMTFGDGAMIISSEYPEIKIPKDGVVDYKVNNLKYDTKYCIVVQLFKPDYSQMSKVLTIKFPNSDTQVGTISISKSEGKITEPKVIDLGVLTIPGK